jgi:hypothetical protein
MGKQGLADPADSEKAVKDTVFGVLHCPVTPRERSGGEGLFMQSESNVKVALCAGAGLPSRHKFQSHPGDPTVPLG